MKSWIWLLLWISLILHGWCVDWYFGMFDVLAWWMFWHGQCFGAVNGLALSMLWRCRCYGLVNILEWLMFWCSRTNAGERQSLRDLKYQPHLHTDCTKTLTTPKHRPHRITDNAGPKGQLVSKNIIYGPVWVLFNTLFLVILENIILKILQDLSIFFVILETL